MQGAQKHICKHDGLTAFNMNFAQAEDSSITGAMETLQKLQVKTICKKDIPLLMKTSLLQ